MTKSTSFPMRVAMIGAGRVANSMTPAIVAAGHTVVGVWSRTATSAQRLAKAVGVPHWTSLADVSNDADMYIVSVSDNAVTEVANALFVPDGAICVHTAGSLSREALGRWADRGSVLYPLQTFSNDHQVDFAHVNLFIETGDALMKERLRAFAESLTASVYEMTWEERRYLHLAAVFACNFSNHCYALAEKILARHGLPFNVMIPLIDETTRKIHTMSPTEAQTGPAVRMDSDTIRKHMAILDEDRPTQAIYDRMTTSIIHHTSGHKNEKRDDE